MRVDPFGGEERKTLDWECGFVVEVEMELDTAVNLVYKQAEIERYIEAALISDGIPIESFWRNLNGLRSVLFSPHKPCSGQLHSINMAWKFNFNRIYKGYPIV